MRWLVNGLLVDNQYEHNSGDVIENRLLWPSVQRTDLNSVFTCQALNTQLDKPKEKSFLLDMHCKYKHIRECVKIVWQKVVCMYLISILSIVVTICK